MLIGYARVSTEEQNLDLQLDELKSAGCKDIFSDKISGGSFKRENFEKAMQFLRAGDTLVIWKLDRLSRSLQDLIKIVNLLKDRGIELKSLREKLDTSSSSGKLMFHVFAALAEFERDTIRDRTKAGLAAARARGRVGGRPKGLNISAQNKAIAAASLYKEGILTSAQIAKQLSIGSATLYRYLKHQGIFQGLKIS